MQGFRTIVALWVSAVAAPWLLQHAGIALTPEQQAEVVAVVIATVGTVMRFLTSTPVGQKAKKLVALNEIDPAAVNAITKLVTDEINRRYRERNTP